MAVAEPRASQPLTENPPSRVVMIVLWAFVIVPFVALLASIPLAVWAGWAPSLLDIALMVVMIIICIGGVGTGNHRLFTHNSYKAKRGLRIGLAIAGSLSLEGNIVQWVADHRKHHQFSDREGDPHSPWRFGTSVWALTRGLWFAHVGWLLKRELANRKRFAKDLLEDRDMAMIDRAFPLLAVTSLVGPAVLAGLVTWSWHGAFSALLWAGLVRIALVHHITWSINSVCHVFGERPFATHEGDKASNFWPLAILSFGECWHNLHHADPTCARHGVLRGQIDINARLIWLYEKLGWAWDVKWPKPERVRQLQRAAAV